jgi:cell fate regulator YaaT (PSP1 superfamily)
VLRLLHGLRRAVPERRVVRRRNARGRTARVALRADEPRVRRITREKVAQYNLKMKVSEAEWQFDRNKLTIYFTAERRVDFRELVRDLARTFRTRIELKQIGVRDEAALLGGVGRCGRELCCSSWLRELKPVSLQLAKDQRLSLNPAQISGCCGRLMCCLTYEHDAYVQARKRFPREGKTLVTAVGRRRSSHRHLARARLPQGRGRQPPHGGAGGAAASAQKAPSGGAGGRARHRPRHGAASGRRLPFRPRRGAAATPMGAADGRDGGDGGA